MDTWFTSRHVNSGDCLIMRDKFRVVENIPLEQCLPCQWGNNEAQSKTKHDACEGKRAVKESKALGALCRGLVSGFLP